MRRGAGAVGPRRDSGRHPGRQRTYHLWHTCWDASAKPVAKAVGDIPRRTSIQLVCQLSKTISNLHRGPRLPVPYHFQSARIMKSAEGALQRSREHRSGVPARLLSSFGRRDGVGLAVGAFFVDARFLTIFSYRCLRNKSLFTKSILASPHTPQFQC